MLPAQRGWGISTQLWNSHQKKSTPELQLNKADASDTEAPFLDLQLSIFSYGYVSSKSYDKRDDFDFDKVFVFLF